MQSIAPGTVEIEVTGSGVETGGHPRAVGWIGYVSRAAAKALIKAEKAKMYAPEHPAAKVVEADDAVGHTADQKEQPVSEEETSTNAGSKRVPRSK